MARMAETYRAARRNQTWMWHGESMSHVGKQPPQVQEPVSRKKLDRLAKQAGKEAMYRHNGLNGPRAVARRRRKQDA